MGTKKEELDPRDFTQPIDTSRFRLKKPEEGFRSGPRWGNNVKGSRSERRTWIIRPKNKRPNRGAYYIDKLTPTESHVDSLLDNNIGLSYDSLEPLQSTFEIAMEELQKYASFDEESGILSGVDLNRQPSFRIVGVSPYHGSPEECGCYECRKKWPDLFK